MQPEIEWWRLVSIPACVRSALRHASVAPRQLSGITLSETGERATNLSTSWATYSHCYQNYETDVMQSLNVPATAMTKASDIRWPSSAYLKDQICSIVCWMCHRPLGTIFTMVVFRARREQCSSPAARREVLLASWFEVGRWQLRIRRS